MHILAISGSLRAASSNTTLLRAAAILAPEGVEFDLYDGLGTLPHFNPEPSKRSPRSRRSSTSGRRLPPAPTAC